MSDDGGMAFYQTVQQELQQKEEIMNKIAAAFVKAQKEFGPALKTSTNPHFKSRYADLSNCVEAVIDALNNNGIALIQNSHECADGVIVETIFLHESGETISTGKLHVPAAKNDPQGYGSALTYCRRYSLMAACGIAPEDDDGNASSKPKTTVTSIKKPDSLETLKKAAAKGTAAFRKSWTEVSEHPTDPAVIAELKTICESADYMIATQP